MPITISFPLAACVNFTQVSYTAFEDDGFVQICVDLEGYIEDYLIVYLFTIPGTALGKLSDKI